MPPGAAGHIVVIIAHDAAIGIGPALEAGVRGSPEIAQLLKVMIRVYDLYLRDMRFPSFPKR